MNLSVKAGHLSVSHLRDLRGVLDREMAEIGVLIWPGGAYEAHEDGSSGSRVLQDSLGEPSPVADFHDKAAPGEQQDRLSSAVCKGRCDFKKAPESQGGRTNPEGIANGSRS